MNSRIYVTREENTSRCNAQALRKTITASTFLGGDSPAFSDYAVAGIFYWARTLSCFEILESGDPVFSWLEEVLNLYSSQFKRPEDAPMA